MLYCPFGILYRLINTNIRFILANNLNMIKTMFIKMMQLEKVWFIKVPLNADCRGGYRHFYKGARLNKKNIGFQNNLF